MLSPSLADTDGTATQDDVQTWVDSFDLKAPVLADRAWGAYAMDVASFPTYIVFAPDLEVIEIQLGFSAADLEAEVLEDAGS